MGWRSCWPVLRVPGPLARRGLLALRRSSFCFWSLWQSRSLGGELRSKRGSPLYKNINIRTHTTLARLSGGNLWNGGNAGRFYANLNNWLDGGNWNYAARISVMIIVVCFVVLKTTRKAWAECPKFLKPASSRQQCREDPATEVGAGRG